MRDRGQWQEMHDAHGYRCATEEYSEKIQKCCYEYWFLRCERMTINNRSDRIRCIVHAIYEFESEDDTEVMCDQNWYSLSSHKSRKKAKKPLFLSSGSYLRCFTGRVSQELVHTTHFHHLSRSSYRETYILGQDLAAWLSHQEVYRVIYFGALQE